MNGPKTLQDAASRVGACLNHASLEFNNLVRMAREQGVELIATPAPYIDTVALDKAIGEETPVPAQEDIGDGPGTDASEGTLEGVAITFTALDYDSVLVEGTLEGKTEPESVTSSLPKLEELIAQTRVRTTSAAKEALLDAALTVGGPAAVSETINGLGKAAEDIRPVFKALVKVFELYPNDSIVGQLLSMTRYCDDPRMIDDFIRLVDERTAARVEEFGEQTRKAIAGTASPTVPVQEEEIPESGAVFKLPAVGELSTTIGDTEGYEKEAGVTVSAEVVQKLEAALEPVVHDRAYYRKKWVELEEAFARKNGMGILASLLNNSVAIYGKGELSYEPPMNVDTHHLYLGRFDDDVLAIHPATTGKFPMGVYTVTAAGTKTLYLPTKMKHGDLGEISFAIDNFLSSPKYFVCCRGLMCTDWLSIEDVGSEEELVDIWVLLQNAVIQISNALTVK